MASEVKTHIRRCHVCGETTEREHGTVGKCHSCGKQLAPFYFFDESQMEGVGDTIKKAPTAYRDREPYYQPIWGLTVFW